MEDVLAELGAAPQAQRSRGRLIRADRVEDGHSATQNTLYWHLWRSGRQVKGSRSRFIQAGYGQLQSALGIDRSNVQDAIRELQKKLSIRIVKASTVGSATVYEVYSCEEILLKRRENRMLWVRKFGTRRADFVSEVEMDMPSVASEFSPTGFAPIGDAPTSLTPIGRSPAGTVTTVGLTPTEPSGDRPPGGVGVKPIQIGKNTAIEQPTTASRLILNALHDEFGYVDDDAAVKIAKYSRDQAPDATDEEIIFHIRQQARRLKNNQTLHNPLGVLITQIPKCFEGESFRRFREERRNQGREFSEEPSWDVEKYKQILDDPQASDEERQVARRVLNCFD